LSRYRAKTAASETDRQIARHLDEASRHVEQALEQLRQNRTAARPRKRRVEDELHRALGMLAGVGTVENRYGSDEDPDLIPEETRAERWRAERKAERQAQEAQGSTG
jgi:uncharacterized membrane protein YccC